MRKLPGHVVRKSWDSGADAWDDFVETGKDWHRHHVHGPALLKACGRVRGLRILDLGCGQGYFSRVLARHGAQVTGIDISARQLAHARRHERKERLGISYVRIDAARVAEHFPPGSFDLVTACMAVEDMPDPVASLVAARRVLRPGGQLVFSAVHPVMSVSRREWVRNRAGRKVGYTIGPYFVSGVAHCDWTMTRLKYHWRTPYHRLTVDGWSRLIARARFLIRRLYEPRPTAATVARHPEIADCRDFPSFLVFDIVGSTRASNP